MSTWQVKNVSMGGAAWTIDGLSSTRTRERRTDGPQTDDALTIKPDHPMGARQVCFVIA